MSHTLGIGLGLLIAGVAAMGCTTPEEDSCNIRTPGIYVEYEVVESDNSATARATFWVGDAPGGTVLYLGQCGDAVTVNGQPLNKDGDLYRASLTPADSYEFIFERSDEDPYISSVSTPPAVNVSAPSGESISRASSFDVEWDANGSGSLDLLIEGDCIKDYPNVMGDSVPDNGLHTVNAGAIKPFVSSDENESCTATVELTRESGGSLSPSLKGTIKGQSVGTTSFKSTP
ncbi:MAG: hypothetical protein ACOC1F_06965 [Myxococcota bacterium]